jgi:hypothetical protein
VSQLSCNGWRLVDLDGNPVDAIMNERVDGAFWIIGNQEIPAPRQGDTEIRQAIYRRHGYQVLMPESETPNK